MQLVKTAAVTLLLSFLCAACKDKPAPKAPPPKKVDILTLRPEQVRDSGEYLGALISRQSVNVLPQVAGYVRKIHVRPGDKVQAGATLLEIDARQESAALESAQAQRSSAQANAALAEQTLVRTQALYKEGLVSAQELERAQAAADAAKASTQSAGAQVSQRQVQLQYYDVRAPFAGTVGDVVVRVGDFASATTVLTTIAQADVLEVSVGIPPERARMVSNDTVVEVLDNNGKVLLTTQAYFVAPQADARTQLVDVKAVFPNTAGLRPSELVRTRLIYSTKDAISVPALAVVRQSGQSFVFTLAEKDGKTVVTRRPVTLGALGESAYVVEKGLSAGDKVAVSALMALKDGLAVQPVESQTQPTEAAKTNP